MIPKDKTQTYFIEPVRTEQYILKLFIAYLVIDKSQIREITTLSFRKSYLYQ